MLILVFYRVRLRDCVFGCGFEEFSTGDFDLLRRVNTEAKRDKLDDNVPDRLQDFPLLIFGQIIIVEIMGIQLKIDRDRRGRGAADGGDSVCAGLVHGVGLLLQIVTSFHASFPCLRQNK